MSTSPAAVNPDVLKEIQRILSDNDIETSDILLSILKSKDDYLSSARSNLLCSTQYLTHILDHLAGPEGCPSAENIRAAHRFMRGYYAEEICAMSRMGKGYHYHAKDITPETLATFSIDTLAKDIKGSMPLLWSLFRTLLDANPRRRKSGESETEDEEMASPGGSGDEERRAKQQESSEWTDESGRRASPEDEGWEDDGLDTGTRSGEDEEDEEENEADSSEEGMRGNPAKGVRSKFSKSQRRAAKRRKALRLLKTVVMSSICMHSTNERCNALQTVIGFFLHATRVPERVVEMLAHCGITIAPRSILRMNRSASLKSVIYVRQTAKSLTNAYALDNLDIALDTEQPTLENKSKLLHITSATMVPLHHGVTKDDLKVSRQLWDANPLNPSPPPGIDAHKPPSYASHLKARPTYSSTDPRHLNNLFAWHVREILLSNEPSLRKIFPDALGNAPVVNQIPAIRTTQIPLSAMNINVSTNEGNAAALEGMLRQGGLGNDDINGHVILVHGDLGTIEKIASMQDARKVERTERDRLQYPILIPGGLHIRMACVEAIEKLYFTKGAKVVDDRTILHFIGILRPKDVSKFANGNAGFRGGHNVIHHLLWALILECWTSVIAERFKVESLAEWAARLDPPKWEDVVSISIEIVDRYVAKMAVRRTNPETTLPETTDAVHKNVKLFIRDAMLYVSLCRSMKFGDVGRVLDLLVPWSFLFKGTHKHKYAAHMCRFLHDLATRYPERLRRAIKMNWFCNPSGKPDGFRAVDWLVEKNNLHIKRKQCGQSSNRTIKFIIQQSPLIEVFANAFQVIEKSFYLTKRTLQHPPPKMTKTLTKLRHHMKEVNAVEAVKDRTSKISYLDAMAEGMSLMQKTALLEGFADSGEPNSGEGQAVLAQDIAVDL